jgi:hypothetical protein
VRQALFVQQWVAHVGAAHLTFVPHVLGVLHSISHDVVALQTTPAAHDVPV